MFNEIPEWFFQMRRDVWDKLSPFIGKVITDELCKEVEDEVNSLIDGWKQPVTHKGMVVKGVVITKEHGIQLVY